MTMPIDEPTPSHAAPYAVSVWDMVPAYLWAAVVLGVQAWWLWARDLEISIPLSLGIGVLGVCSLILFLWATWKGFKANNDPGRLAVMDRQMRSLLALAALVGGGLLLLMALWLCFAEKEKLQVFAEISSLAVMGLICLAGGLALRLTPQNLLSQQVLLQGLLKIRNQLGIVMIVLGLGLGGAGLYVLFGQKALPEGLGLLAIGLVFLGGGMWTQITLQQAATTDTMRVLVLYTGSLTGLCIALFTAMRVGLWWQTYFSGGIRTWQGEDGWRFWLCAYIELGGLLLLFASLLLARVDIRANVSMRRLLFGYNAFLTGILLLAVLVVINIVVYVKLPSNVEWTATMGMYSLSGTTASMLASLKQKVNVFVVMSRYGPSFSDVHDMLDNCEGITNKLNVEYISPDLDVTRYRELARVYPELRKQAPSDFGGGGGGRGLLITYGDAPEGEKLPHEFVPEKDLEEGGGFDPAGGGGGGTKAFKGEQVLVQTIQRLAENSKKPKVYFTQLSGELWINDLDFKGMVVDNRLLCNELAGAGTVVGKLRKDNYDVQGLVWDPKAATAVNRLFPGEQVAIAGGPSKDKGKETIEVPADCKVLVIANPSHAFSKEALEAIDRYLEHGGKVMVLTKTGLLPNDKFSEDGMEEFCKKLNVEVTNDFIVKASNQPDGVLTVTANVPPEAKNKVASQFVRSNFTFVLPRTVRPGKTPGQYQGEVILQVTEQANGEVWAATGSAIDLVQTPLAFIRNLRNQDKGRDKVSPEPLPVGVAVTDREGHPRAMIIGDDSFITSDYFQQMPGKSAGYEFFRSSLEWLGERPVGEIGIRSKERQFYQLSKDDVKGGRFLGLPIGLVWLPLALGMLALAGTGAGIWIVRRK